ncbi:hypothetical protein N7508_004029 [Penicillium antarcticum]|uniref:uncharacterized protein n=1 Tax=Penicillium antarcticum TaxID=416450 RepID=UPI0023A5458A|nr:uncharacterized protein N7508_004029 [Penicillium antarcticum]KAJ5308650.1 hypothetical protein N7508_004029 [Penicillium antarcticum]
MARPLFATLILIILCISTFATLAQPVEASDQPDAVARSAWEPSGEIADQQRSFRSKEHLAHEKALQRRILTASTSSSSELPTPYDTLSYDFANSTSCINFYKKWRANSTITDCHAVSLLLTNSNSFFHTLTSAAATSRVLDASCSQDVSQCSAIMSSLAADLLGSDNCAEDYGNGNSVVTGTYKDLVAYEPMYRATCLTSPSTQDYCFVDAVSNSSAPDDYNVYFMPIGSALSAGAEPTCSQCLQATMALFARWAKKDGQSLDTTYLPSARIINSHCGSEFASTNVTVGSNVISGASFTASLPGLWSTAVVGLMLAILTNLF